ncbi:U-box domain-containing protein 32-like isoform X1 [Cucurbita pepo subsp. pepo]|uniref:U-box domain-containing protein 32-like isoform X1 n=1 Tax=Cucurbita pepo subsp. pepo TaxID=3664 RepID=UPI000C9DA5E5|nr:U-box domain-containing protein 32-like isoform X1 [Cucurbita pepo subsp. pepo]
MGTAEETVQHLQFDVEDTIFVAVGTDADDAKATLLWAVQNFACKTFCLLHVHQLTPRATSPKHEDPSSHTLKEHVAKAFEDLQRQKSFELLNQYVLILAKLGVRAQKILIATNSVERGIVEIIDQYSIKWLVMGLDAERYNLKMSTGLKSKKAFFVSQQAPICCHIWFVCRGRLMYSREGGPGRFNKLQLQNTEIGINHTNHLRPESVTCKLNLLDAQEQENAFDSISRFIYEGQTDPKFENLGTSRTTLLLKNEVSGLQEAASMNVTPIKEFEGVKAWIEEEAVDAEFKAKSLESSCVEEVKRRNEMEEILASSKKEVERMNKEHDKLLKELHRVHEQKSLLERKASESRCDVEELEKKMFAAVDLLVSFKEKRDKLQIEQEDATNELRKLKNMVERESSCNRRAEMPTFSFMEIIEATRNFDPSWKIGEGRHGSVYKGVLRHMDVALKMFPSYGSHSQSTFQYEVELLSRVRHPNLVSIIGACPESRLIVYENMKNSSLEDHLACKNRPLPWQIRIRVAADICLALIFLHYSEPCIVHGDIKPSKILLDANFIAKLGGLGITRLIPQEQKAFDSASVYSLSKENNSYIDPKYLETGRLTPESDVYSLGVTLLRVLTGRAPPSIVNDVKCALENDQIGAILDSSAGDWPHDLAEQLALVALRCCEKEKSNRPDLVSELWSVLEPMRSIASASCSSLKKHSRVPAHFACPIFQEIMKDPLIAADGFTYEADAIRGWFESGHNTSPMTNLKVEHCNLVPNYALLNAIQEWQHQL